MFSGPGFNSTLGTIDIHRRGSPLVGCRPIGLWVWIKVFGRPLQVTVRPAIYGSVVLSVPSLCNVGVFKLLDGSRCHLVRRLGLGPGDIVLDGDPAPQGQGTAAPPPIFGPCLLSWVTSWRKGYTSPFSYFQKAITLSVFISTIPLKIMLLLAVQQFS